MRSLKEIHKTRAGVLAAIRSQNYFCKQRDWSTRALA